MPEEESRGTEHRLFILCWWAILAGRQTALGTTEVLTYVLVQARQALHGALDNEVGTSIRVG